MIEQFYIKKNPSLKINPRLFILSEGVKNISNQLTIGTEICAEHAELRAVAQAQGWWSGEGDFSFSAVFSPDNPPARMEMAKKRYMGGTALLQQHNGTFAFLCHHNWGVGCVYNKELECYSQVSEMCIWSVLVAVRCRWVLSLLLLYRVVLLFWRVYPLKYVEYCHLLFRICIYICFIYLFFSNY